MSWHPSLSDADPAMAWFTRAQLERIERDERQAERFRLMVRRRELFEARWPRPTNRSSRNRCEPCGMPQINEAK